MTSLRDTHVVHTLPEVGLEVGSVGGRPSVLSRSD